MITDEQLEDWTEQAPKLNHVFSPEEILQLIAEVQRCRVELDRAWRCISGFHAFRVEGKVMNDTAFAYHCMTVAGARRYVDSNRTALEGASYFEGKSVLVLHEALAYTK